MYIQRLEKENECLKVKLNKRGNEEAHTCNLIVLEKKDSKELAQGKRNFKYIE